MLRPLRGSILRSAREVLGQMESGCELPGGYSRLSAVVPEAVEVWHWVQKCRNCLSY